MPTVSNTTFCKIQNILLFLWGWEQDKKRVIFLKKETRKGKIIDFETKKHNIVQYSKISQCLNFF